MDSEIKELSEKYFTEALGFLSGIVNINSDSNNISGCIQTGDIVAGYFKGLGFTIEEGIGKGNRKYFHLYNQSPDAPAYLCMGHLDTVFPESLGFNSFSIKAGTGYGPGVIDMKGGIITLWLALRILKDLNRFNEIPLKIIFNSDEEIGSESVLEIFNRVKPQLLGIFNFEAARDSGALVKARKGVGDFKIIVTGRSAHSGSHFTSGANAVNELAYKILEIIKLTDLENGITVSPGIVSGGTKVNVVPDHAEVIFDVRIKNNDQRERMIEALNGIVKKNKFPNTQSKLEGNFSRPAFSSTGDVLNAFKYFKESAKSLFNLEFSAEETGGAADINFFGDLKIPMLDGLGPCGGKDHTVDEFIVLESIKERASIFVKSIINLNKDRSSK